MAFSILVNLGPNKIAWKKLNVEVMQLGAKHIECFPIPKLQPTGNNYLGLCVLNTNMDSGKVATIKNIIGWLLDEKYVVVELYGQQAFSKDNLDVLCNKFFSVK